MASLRESLSVRNLSKHYGATRAVDDVSLDIPRGQFVTLLGPSGSGKTTILMAIAGFVQPTAGEILVDRAPITQLPPEKRNFGMVFQGYALFPHMSVAENVAFPLRVRKLGRAETETRVKDALSLVQLGPLADRKPQQLSGGQQQRVALARALVNRPAVLLLDEPLGALDLKLRETMQHELKDLQKRVGITFIYVTHDQEEALTMSDRIAVMSEGRVQQVGTPEQIYNFPANHFVADFIGDTNFLEGKVVSLHEDRTVIKVGREDVTAARANFPLMPGEKVTMVIRPEKLAVARELAPALAPGAEAPPAAAPANPAKPPQPRVNAVINARVLDSVFVGTDTRINVTLKGGTEITVLVRNLEDDEDFKKGEKVVVTYDASDSRLLPAAQLGTTDETYSGNGEPGNGAPPNAK